MLCTDDVAGTAAFWQRHFRFTPAFWSDWYVHLTSDVSPSANLAILDYRHDSLPAPFQRKAQGLLVNFEVEDVDAEYERAVAAGLKIHVTLRDEPFGQRHFITEDPNGVAIDVIKPIPLSPEYAAQFTVGLTVALILISSPVIRGRVGGGEPQSRLSKISDLKFQKSSPLRFPLPTLPRRRGRRE